MHPNHIRYRLAANKTFATRGPNVEFKERTFSVTAGYQTEPVKRPFALVPTVDTSTPRCRVNSARRQSFKSRLKSLKDVSVGNNLRVVLSY